MIYFAHNLQWCDNYSFKYSVDQDYTGFKFPIFHIAHNKEVPDKLLFISKENSGILTKGQIKNSLLYNNQHDSGYTQQLKFSIFLIAHIS